uniref:UBX domain-containing protein n=1 Tax=Caenorhabditis japonica TaxID=281687 RepID=A0A8R1DT99_CAEJA
MDEIRQAAVAQMMDVTNCTENVALDFLTRTNYDVEIAVRHFFEGTIPEALPRTPSSSGSLSTPSHSLVNSESSPEIDRPQAVLPRYHSVLQLFAQFITLPVRLPLILINIVYDYFFGSQPVLYAHVSDYIKKEYPEYKEAMDNVFYRSQLQSLRNDIQTNGWKWLVAYIHDPKGNQDFFKYLFNSNLPEQIRTRGGVFFGSIMASEDAIRLRPDRTFGRSRKPCIIIFVIRGNTLTRKLYIDDLSNSEVVATNIDLALIDLIADENEREANERTQNESRRLMEEQNRQYQQSLQRDMERIAKTRSEEEAARKIQENEKRKMLESEQRLAKVNDYRRTLQENSSDAVGPCELLIRFPTGKKVVKFNEDDSLEKLFEEALKSELCPIFFQMHQNFPKKAVPCLPTWYFEILELEELEPKQDCLSKNATFREAEITHGTMIYIDNL